MADPVVGALVSDAVGEAVHQVVESAPEMVESAPEMVESVPETEVSEVSDSEYESESGSESDFTLTAQQQWEESINQLTSLVNFVFFPYLGKYLGRRAAHTFWRRFANWWWLCN